MQDNMETHYMKKMGRPLKMATPLSHDIKVRVDDELFEKLCRHCESTGEERATVLREGLRRYLETTAQDAEKCYTPNAY